jgi:hypothetical protein
LSEALDRYGLPEIFNADQSSQFTSFGISGALRDAGGSLRPRAAYGFDGQGWRLAHISTGSTAAGNTDKQEFGGMIRQRNTPQPSR